MSSCGTPFDPRIDGDLMAVNQSATALLPRLLTGVQIEQEGSLPVDFSQIWVAYLAAEMYGNADTVLIAIAHNRGRQARILERQMYEMMIKAKFYVANPVDARLEYLSMPFREPTDARFKSVNDYLVFYEPSLLSDNRRPGRERGGDIARSLIALGESWFPA